MRTPRRWRARIRKPVATGSSGLLVDNEVFAPHNFYRGSDSFRWVDKKAKTIKLTMFSFIVAQHRQILRSLASLPFVDAGRIGFYGLSYGGAAALIVPPLLDGYALSICSANFNDDIHKLTATDRGYSYMYTRTPARGRSPSSTWAIRSGTQNGHT